jgi:hypothetical protein
MSKFSRVGSLILLVVIPGCGGGGGGFDPNHVSVAVSPAAVTISTSDQLTLKATVNGLCSTCVSSINGWSITENNGAVCTWFDTLPFGPCPAGTIQATANGSASTLTVTYHAPSTSGTFHVVAEWCICFGSSLKKDGTSVVTVSP